MTLLSIMAEDDLLMTCYRKCEHNYCLQIIIMDFRPVIKLIHTITLVLHDTVGSGYELLPVTFLKCLFVFFLSLYLVFIVWTTSVAQWFGLWALDQEVPGNSSLNSGNDLF